MVERQPRPGHSCGRHRMAVDPRPPALLMLYGAAGAALFLIVAALVGAI